MKGKLATLYQKDGTKKILASLVSILIGLLVGAFVVIIVGLFNSRISLKGAWEGVRLIFFGIFSTGRDASGALTWGFNPTSLGNTLFRAMPLIMTGLSVAVAFKTGLFNIGAPGQYLFGTMASLMVALSLPTEKMGAVPVWIIAFLAGVLAGALWGAIPGAMKAFLNINEVLACIMTNWIAANIVLSMAIAGALSGGGAALYWLSGNTEFFWSTYQSLPAIGFNGIPVALLAVNNPIAVIFTGIFMSMLNVIGLQMSNLTAYNEYLTDIIVAVIVYLSAFALVIRMIFESRKKKAPAAEKKAKENEEPPKPDAAQNGEGGEQA